MRTNCSSIELENKRHACYLGCHEGGLLVVNIVQTDEFLDGTCAHTYLIGRFYLHYTRGSLPVQVASALLEAGDPHTSLLRILRASLSPANLISILTDFTSSILELSWLG